MTVRIKSRKYQVPDFLSSKLSQDKYERWLRRKAIAHWRRDKKRGNNTVTAEDYRKEIHRAVRDSEGKDQYTGERLKWSLISSYKNSESKEHRRKYKAALALLPTVDHVGDGLGEATFRICALRTNAAKSDLSYKDFVKLCRKVIKHKDHPNGSQSA
jgi:hypothetical protein